jgi:signal transduction histidine kinase/CheY-like chemotaxis protein
MPRKLSRAVSGALLFVVACVLSCVVAGSVAADPLDIPSEESTATNAGIDPGAARIGPLVAPLADCIRIDNAFARRELLEGTAVALDPNAQWSLAAAQGQVFAPLSSKKIGYMDGVAWARLCLFNSGTVDRALVLDSGDKYFSSVDVFVLEHAAASHGADDARILKQHRAGLSMPFGERAIAARNIVFPVMIEAGQVVDIYLRYRTQAELRVGPVLYDSTTFIRAQHADDVVIYGFYGALAALFIYNLLLAATSREMAAVACIALIGSWTLLAASWDGTLFQWWPAILGPYRMGYFYVAIPAALIALSIFTIEYLQLRQFGRYFILPQYVLIALALLFLASAWWLPGSILRVCILGLYGATLLCDIVTGLVLLRRGQGHAGIYLIGYLVMFVSLFVATRSIYTPERGYDEVELWVRLAILAPVSIFCLGVGYRINQLKVAATESQQRAVLARSEAEFKSRFLVTMSHEIRTPLNGVVGMIELLQGTPMSDLQQRYADVIHSSGRALMDVINDVLDFSKLEHGKVKLEIIGFNLERLVDECIDVFAITKKSGAVVFNACIEPGTPLLIKGDPTRTKQVLINLVGNAFKFTQAGEVNLAIHLDPYAPVDAPRLRFEITDTGIGMDSEGRRQLFSAFTQADGSIARKYGGTGLGLTICKQLVELMGGTIGVESQQGVGSTFWFTLPLQLPAAGDIVDSLERAPVLDGKRVLVIDDHDAFCHTMRVALESFGMQVTVAQTAAAGRDCLSRDRYDVLMIDRCLPDQDGLELAQELCRAQPGMPPMLLVSVAVDILDDDALQQAGIVAHMIKPISLGNLHSRLVRLFGGEQQWPAPDAVLASELGASLRVLVAEDNPINQIVLGGLLSKLGVESVFVDDGKQAVDRYLKSLDARETPFDAVIMDCEMPVLDGYSATRHIRQHESKYASAQPIRIIGLTAHAIDEYRERALDSGMNDFLTKPVHIETLKRALMLVR